MMTRARTVRPVHVLVAVLAVGLVLVGRAGPVEAFWLPPDFGTNDPFRVVAFGDSITAGVVGGDCPNPDCLADFPYPAVLQSLLSPRYPGVVVVNAGRGGERTDTGVDRMLSVLAAERPGFVLIMDGTNDATDQSAGGRFDPDDIVGNLRAMVQLVKANRSIPILATIPPNFRVGDFQGADAARSIIDAVNAMLPGVAAAEGIRFVDTFSALADSALYGPSDLLHANQAGYDVLGAAWQGATQQAIDDGLSLLIRVYLLQFNKESFRSGETLQVDLTLADHKVLGLVDVYFGVLLPTEARPVPGCPPGDAVAFVADRFSEIVFGCLSDPPGTAVPLYREVDLTAPIPRTTLPDFWDTRLGPDLPAGVYTVFLALTPPGDPSRTLVITSHDFTFAP